MLLAGRRVHIFKKSDEDLYYSDLHKLATGTVLVNTVDYRSAHKYATCVNRGCLLGINMYADRAGTAWI